MDVAALVAKFPTTNTLLREHLIERGFLPGTLKSISGRGRFMATPIWDLRRHPARVRATACSALRHAAKRQCGHYVVIMRGLHAGVANLSLVLARPVPAKPRSARQLHGCRYSRDAERLKRLAPRIPIRS